MKTKLILGLTFLVLLGCSDDDNNKVDPLAWSSAETVQIGDEFTEKIMNCRKVHEYTDDVHVYYKVYVTESIKESQVDEPLYDGVQSVVFQPGAVFEIDHSVNDESLKTGFSGGGLSMHVDMKVVTTDENLVITTLYMNEDSFSYIQSDSVISTSDAAYFKSHEVGDAILQFVRYPDGSVLNLTTDAIPGLELDHDVECKAI